VRPWTEPAALAVEDRLFRALAVLRVVVLLNAIAVNVWRHNNFAHPAAGAAAIAFMAVWTVVVIWAYQDAVRRTTWLLVADLAIAVGLIVLSPPIKGADMLATIPGFWVMGALLAWAVHWRWRGGALAALFLSAADLGVRTEFTQTNYGNVFLLMLGGPIVGYMCESLQRMAAERDHAERAAAAAGERARLARAVHDGVLQVLALVQRRGGELGGDFATLGVMAGEQETALRSLIRQQDGLAHRPGAEVDLCQELQRLESLRPPVVSVATPADPLLLGADRAHEITAVARACLDNVAAHVGPDASAWVLLDRIGGALVLTVRDEGPGIAAGRLAAAVAEGRLGVAQSIRGRIADLGGTAELATGAFGTEWEFTVPIGTP
jgi:signal transduction histidine kinase